LARVTTIKHLPLYLGAIRIHGESKSKTIKTIGTKERNAIVEKYFGSQ